jgi:hypothetical protein
MRILALLLLAPAPLAAQPASPKTLPAPTWTSAEGFSGIRRIRELSDGRVLLIDYKDNRIILVSATGKTVGNVGAEGGGPGEFKQPIELLPLGNDSTLVTDQGLRRFLLIDGTPKPVATMLFPPELANSLNLARTADSKGRVIYPSSWTSKRKDGEAEMVPILAWDRTTSRVDTIASVLASKQVTQEMKGPDGKVIGAATFPVRYTPADDWALLSTGDVAVLHGEPYSADIVTAGKVRIRGPVIAYNKVKVDDSERLPKAVAKDIPDYKPAFWNSTALAGPNGEFWIAREVPAGSKTREYDRFDRAANRTMSVTIESTTRIAGFGRNAMYTVRTDADGLQWLEKRPIPR